MPESGVKKISVWKPEKGQVSVGWELAQEGAGEEAL